MWELQFNHESGLVADHVAELLTALSDAADEARAFHLASLVELKVCPPRGGLAPDAEAVVAVLVPELPWLSAPARVAALDILTQMTGSVSLLRTPENQPLAARLEAALPLFARIVESGTDAEVAHAIDLISLCASLSPAAAERSRFYLGKIATGPHDAVITTGALRELDDITLEWGSPGTQPPSRANSADA